MFDLMKNITVPESIIRGFWKEIETKLIGQRREPSGRRKFRRVLSWGVPSLTAAVLLVVLLLSPWNHSIQEYESADIIVEWAEIDGQDAKLSILKLTDPDMTIIWLDK